MRLTVNFVPSLVAQLEAVVDGRARRVAARSRDADRELDAAERAVPRRALLLAQLGARRRAAAALPRAAREARAQRRAERAARARAPVLRRGAARSDGAVLPRAGSASPRARATAELAALEHKGRDYDARGSARWSSSGSARPARACCRSIASSPSAGRSSCRRRRTTTRSCRCSSTATRARRARPDAAAARALRLARATRARRSRAAPTRTRAPSARRPRGMWPPEGSVSPEAVAAYRARRHRLARHRRGQPVALARAGGRRTRRAAISIAPGATAASTWCSAIASSPIASASPTRTATPHAGVADLLGARARGRGSVDARPPASRALVPVFLDGENPWEAYPGSGEPFLRALFERARARRASSRAASIGEHLDARAGARRAAARCTPARGSTPTSTSGSATRSRTAPGSCSARARRRFERRARRAAPTPRSASTAALRAPARRRGLRLVLVVRRAVPLRRGRALRSRSSAPTSPAPARALGEPPPDELDAAGGAARRRARGRVQRRRCAFIRPRIDGHGAAASTSGTAPAATRCRAAPPWPSTPLVERIHFGFDRDDALPAPRPAPARAAELDGATLEVERRPSSSAARLRRATCEPTATPALATLVEAADGDALARARRGRPAPTAAPPRVELGVAASRASARAPGDRLRAGVPPRRAATARAGALPRRRRARRSPSPTTLSRRRTGRRDGSAPGAAASTPRRAPRRRRRPWARPRGTAWNASRARGSPASARSRPR